MKIKMNITTITNYTPTLGGGVGALYAGSTTISGLPTMELIITTMILAVFGAVTGYLVGLFMKWFTKNIKKLFNVFRRS